MATRVLVGRSLAPSPRLLRTSVPERPPDGAAGRAEAGPLGGGEDVGEGDAGSRGEAAPQRSRSRPASVAAAVAGRAHGGPQCVRLARRVSHRVVRCEFPGPRVRLADRRPRRSPHGAVTAAESAAPVRRPPRGAVRAGAQRARKRKRLAARETPVGARLPSAAQAARHGRSPARARPRRGWSPRAMRGGGAGGARLRDARRHDAARASTTPPLPASRAQQPPGVASTSGSAAAVAGNASATIVFDGLWLTEACCHHGKAPSSQGSHGAEQQHDS